ncbi:putative histidine acid phosphatase [Piedraia hortae CBS 480.64]|uniref:Putative histidine acid phosphatase n=1 Tax=Piedraia hortae CBS 480.64 TaxID=1314780 RepID=A0A6A7C008_9PEZI|nr:putative histidine acid phosphatase [Piedraia hortae CBS 480.64]
MAKFILTCFLALAAAQGQRPLYSDYEFNPLEHLAGTTPFFEPSDPPRGPPPPRNCKVTKSAHLVRHAAINANDFDYETYLHPFVEKISNSSVDWIRVPGLSFLDGWKAPQTEELELVTRTGKLEAAQLGVQISYRYPELRLPKRIWSSSAERTYVSAKSFIRGLEMEDNDISLVVLDEGKKAGADSLTPYKSCPAYSSSAGSKESQKYVDVYTKPIIARLRAQAPGMNWTSSDIVAMFEWCGYETVMRGSSAFCSSDLFTPDEWLAFEYAQDIQYFYNSGYGSNVAGYIGYPWVEATISTLLDPPKNDEQDIYVSFTHRELPPAVLVAMGLFNNTEFTPGASINATMPFDRINYGRAWKSSYILPFLTNIAIEKMACSGSYGYANGTYYRAMVNQSPQTLAACHDGPAESCSEAGLTEYLKQRKELFGGFSKACGATYSNTTDTLGIYTRNLTGVTVGKRGVM